MSKHAVLASLIALVFAAPGLGHARAAQLECRLQPAQRIPPEVLNNGFLEAHPDLRWRSHALGLYREGKYERALRSFRTAALYADKFSQSMVARMYWQGQGTEVDRALAYAWMDLAAERMYHDFLRQRELYWEQLDESERASALRRGEAVYARFADAHAKPRMEKKLRRAREEITGSRVGYLSAGLEVSSPADITRGHANVMLPAQVVYDKRWWEPQQYWCSQDAYWARPLDSSVEVGGLEQLPDMPPPSK